MTDVVSGPLVEPRRAAARMPHVVDRLLSVPRRRWEPWRDAAIIAVVTHAVLIVIVLMQPRGMRLVLAGLVLAVCFGVGTLTVLHDAGHRMFSPREWPNAAAVQIATPAGLWVGHWTLKHRVHHKQSQVYPIDEATRSSSMVRMHPAAPSNRWQRGQHVYAWALYGLAWMGELRSQLRYLRTGEVAGAATPPLRHRVLSFAGEKALCFAVLTPYVWLLGWRSAIVLMVVAETLASVFAAVFLVIGHINEGLTPNPAPGMALGWAAHLVSTTANFSTSSRFMSFLSGGLTHHLAHHLRPVAVRSELRGLTDTVVRDVVAASGFPLVEYRSLPAAIAGHYRKLRELGRHPLPVLPALKGQDRLPQGEYAA